MVEFLDFREADIDLRFPAAAFGIDHFRQAVQGLWAEHQIDIGCALEDGFAFLRGHAAADADDQIRVAGFQFAPAAELGENLLLRFFTDGAGVDQDDVGLVFVLGQFQAVAGIEYVRHFVRVVLVHLAAVGFDVQLLGGGFPGHGAYSGREGRPL